MGIEAIALIVSFTALVALLFLLGRLMVTLLKIALIALVLWFALSKISSFRTDLFPKHPLKHHPAARI